MMIGVSSNQTLRCCFRERYRNQTGHQTLDIPQPHLSLKESQGLMCEV